MRTLLFALSGLLLLPTVATAQSAEFTYNSYKRDIKKQLDYGWEELQAADASSTQEARCRHASSAVYSYKQAAQISETMTQILSHSGGEYHDAAVAMRDAARDVAQTVENLYNQKCG
ncbi:hypothetical protein [Asticcacaulis sp. AC402]|uniref:hypothetical protein n=1 Tax=Asticcacaulis sp. AC402 TaxID=1282361 RepID=UPI0003C40EA6|nr:hypothetical protein [Asticcacaulis sp. AC402]ESQ76078.1 hypothetical protein ABAC402_06425 [Asticcacaulis sp. AC402]